MGDYTYPLRFETIGYDSEPDWSAPGEVIAVYNQLIRARDGRLVATLPGTVFQHAFSPDGRQLAVIQGDPDTTGYWFVRPHGSEHVGLPGQWLIGVGLRSFRPLPAK